MPASKRKHVRKRKIVCIEGHTPEPVYAEELGLKEETLRKKRLLGETSDYIIVGRQVHYVDADKRPWLERIRKTGVRSGQKSSRVQSRSGHAANP